VSKIPILPLGTVLLEKDGKASRPLALWIESVQTQSMSGASTGPLSIVANCPNGSVGAAYQGALSATGGVLPYAYSTSGGTGLPPGLSITSTGTNAGQITGTPTTPGTYTFVGTVTDAASNTATVPCSITVVTPGSGTLPGNPSSVAITDIGHTLDGVNQTRANIQLNATLPGTQTVVHGWYAQGTVVGGSYVASGNSTTLNGAISTTPAAGTLETWVFNSLTDIIANHKRYIRVDGEICEINTSGGQVIRGSLGTTPATHANSAPVFVFEIAAIPDIDFAGTSLVYVYRGSDGKGQLIFGTSGLFFMMVLSTGNNAGDNWSETGGIASNILTLSDTTPASTDGSAASPVGFTYDNVNNLFSLDIGWILDANPGDYYANLTVEERTSGGVSAGPERLVYASAINSVPVYATNIRAWGPPSVVGNVYWFRLRVVNRASPLWSTGVIIQCWNNGGGPNTSLFWAFDPRNPNATAYGTLPPIQTAHGSTLDNSMQLVGNQLGIKPAPGGGITVTGAGVSATGSIAPADSTGLTASGIIDPVTGIITLTVSVTAPADPLFLGCHLYAEIPDQSATPVGNWNPLDLGVQAFVLATQPWVLTFPHPPGVSINSNTPARLYAASYATAVDNSLVRAGLAGATPNTTFTLTSLASGTPTAGTNATAVSGPVTATVFAPDNSTGKLVTPILMQVATVPAIPGWQCRFVVTWFGTDATQPSNQLIVGSIFNIAGIIYGSPDGIPTPHTFALDTPTTSKIATVWAQAGVTDAAGNTRWNNIVPGITPATPISLGSTTGVLDASQQMIATLAAVFRVNGGSGNQFDLTVGGVTTTYIANLAVTNAKIGLLAVGDANINDCNISKLTAGTATFTGTATFQESGGGNSVVISASGLTLTASSNTLTLTSSTIQAVNGSNSLTLSASHVQLVNGSNQVTVQSSGVNLSGGGVNFVNLSSTDITLTGLGSNSIAITSSQILISGSTTALELTSSAVILTNTANSSLTLTATGATFVTSGLTSSVYVLTSTGLSGNQVQLAPTGVAVTFGSTTSTAMNSVGQIFAFNTANTAHSLVIDSVAGTLTLTHNHTIVLNASTGHISVDGTNITVP